MFFLQAALAGYKRFRNRRSWERVWRKPGNNPPWMAETPRPFVLRGFDHGWLVPGMKVLEIGCGRGNTAIWLARCGFKVLGIDVSGHAIRQAREAFPTQEGLAFEIVDICERVSFGATFDVILDTGCLQHLSSDLRAHYRDNILRASHAGSRFVVTLHTIKSSLDARRAEVQALFSPAFKLVHTEEVPPANTEVLRHLNAVFHLIRNEERTK
jgi:2-polyprenyl-3-methyl-5-hydroxy-6-metoxy-1,4-benzoquinol methylase